jgi:hypothetical protein
MIGVIRKLTVPEPGVQVPFMGWIITADHLGLLTTTKGARVMGPFPNMTRAMNAVHGLEVSP